MSNQHKNPTISFRVSEYERKTIEARILASGMMKKDYFVRSCIYCHASNSHSLWQCIFRENCASVPKERSAIPLETERSSAS